MLVMKATCSLVWVQRQTLLSLSNWKKTVPKLYKDLNEWWRRMCHDLGDVFCGSTWVYLTELLDHILVCISITFRYCAEQI